MQSGRQSRLLSRTYLEYICLFCLFVCVLGGGGGGGGVWGGGVTRYGLSSTSFYAWYLLEDCQSVL